MHLPQHKRQKFAPRRSVVAPPRSVVRLPQHKHQKTAPPRRLNSRPRRRAVPGAGGEGGIRTLDGLLPIPVFETGAFNHSATSPQLCI